EDAMGFSLLYLWIGLPASNLLASILTGRSSASGVWKTAAALIFGFLYMMAGYLTFSLANMLSYQNTVYPEWREFLIGTGISAAGMLAGWAAGRAKGKNSR
ncbi:MAG: transcriptional regulator, partial [Eubacterium sp.]